MRTHKTVLHASKDNRIGPRRASRLDNYEELPMAGLFSVAARLTVIDLINLISQNYILKPSNRSERCERK